MADVERKLDYRSPEWLAEQLGVDKSTIYRYLQDGTLPGLQLGRKWLVSERQVVEFLDAEARHQTERKRKARSPRRLFGPGRRDRFDKFTDKAFRVLNAAHEEALDLRHDYVGTEHQLLALVKAYDCLGAIALKNLGADAETVIRGVTLVANEGPAVEVSRSDSSLSPRAKKVIEMAIDEARRMNHAYIGTEHLVLGLLRDEDGVAFGILGSLGISLEATRTEVSRLLEVREG